MSEVRLVIVDPGHYHAALIQKDMYPRVSPRVSVYAPLAPELFDYLNRVSLFNSRKDSPTKWELDVHTGAGFFERMLGEHQGNVVVFAGRNREKIGRILESLNAGYNVLADKPWVISSADLPKLALSLDTAEAKGLVGYDVMTERHEITSILQKELVNATDVFGQLVPGSEAEPAVTAKSIHHLMKLVSGVPFRRPAWFFNIDESGEGIADVGTHVVDLVQWTAFPVEQVDYRADVQMLDARRWPTMISRAQFTQVTGEPDFPADLAQWVKGGQFEYYCNTYVHYTVRGAHVKLDILWNWEAPAGSGDVYEATFRGTRSRAEIRQGKAENFRPELYVRPNTAALRDGVFAALRTKIDGLRKDWPGLEVTIRGEEAHIVIPEKYRAGHEDHFAQVTRAFLGYLGDPKSLPAWEKSNMLVKYYISTNAVELSRGR
jgi:predicted dehydrogenase